MESRARIKEAPALPPPLVSAEDCVLLVDVYMGYEGANTCADRQHDSTLPYRRKHRPPDERGLATSIAVTGAKLHQLLSSGSVRIVLEQSDKFACTCEMPLDELFMDEQGAFDAEGDLVGGCPYFEGAFEQWFVDAHLMRLADERMVCLLQQAGDDDTIDWVDGIGCGSASCTGCALDVKTAQTASFMDMTNNDSPTAGAALRDDTIHRRIWRQDHTHNRRHRFESLRFEVKVLITGPASPKELAYEELSTLQRTRPDAKFSDLEGEVKQRYCAAAVDDAADADTHLTHLELTFHHWDAEGGCVYDPSEGVCGGVSLLHLLETIDWG